MTEDEMIKKVSSDLGYPEDVVRLAFRSQYKFIIDKIRSLDLSIRMSKEDFDKQQTNFSLLDLGKFYCTWDDMLRTRRYYDYVLPKIKSGGYKKNKDGENTQ